MLARKPICNDDCPTSSQTGSAPPIAGYLPGNVYSAFPGRQRVSEGVDSMLRRYVKSGGIISAESIDFEGVSGCDVYNPTAPFRVGDATIIAARVEPRDDEFGSESVFFRKDGERWVPDQSAVTLKMQDPNVKRIGNELLVSGIKVYGGPDRNYVRQVFFRGTDLHNLTQFAEGPRDMKDIRLSEHHARGRVGVFPRPEGRIGYREIGSLDELPHTDLNDPEYLIDFGRGVWAGVNEVHPLDGHFGVLGHVARYSKGFYRTPDGTLFQSKHYYPFSCVFDFDTGRISRKRILATRSDLPGDIAAKRVDTEDVIFPGGIRFGGDTAELYVGVSDAHSFKITIGNPWPGYSSRN